MAEISGLNLVTVDPFGPNTNIISAIATAAAAPGGAVWIPASYTGTDSVPASPGVPVFDMRSTGSIKMGTASVGAAGQSLATATAAAAVAGATGGTFVTTLNCPGGSVLNGVPFKVKASGWAALSGGTWTATVQPIVYASGVSGFTASAAAAIFTAAAVNVTIATALLATIKYVPWEVEITLDAATTPGLMVGRYQGSITNGTLSLFTAAPIGNPTTVGTVNMGATVPIQFLAGVTLGGTADSTGTESVTLSSFFVTN